MRILELDQIRKTLTPEPRYTDTERDVVYRALGWMARLLTEAGIPVIVDATAHRRAWRDLTRATIPHFAEVQIVCPLEVARARERSRSGSNPSCGIYEHAGQPGTPVPGLDVPYEPALFAELIIDSDRESVAEAAHRIADLAVRLAVGSEVPVLDTTGWAIWITGRPGTGKTTVTSRVVEALATRGVPVRALDLDEVRRQLVPGGRVSETDREILHRALAYATKLLTDAGTAVIIDAAAPRRSWRQAAREMIPCFAEIYLVCPMEVCVDRERAARWGLGGKAPALAADRSRRRTRHHPGLRGIPSAGAHRPYGRGRPVNRSTKDPVPGPAPAPAARDRARDVVTQARRRPMSTNPNMGGRLNMAIGRSSRSRADREKRGELAAPLPLILKERPA